MSWVENCIKDLPIVIADGNYSSKYPKASEFLSEGVPFLSAYNLESGTIIDHNTKYISEEHHSKLVKGHIKKGDVLLVTRGSIGKVAKVPGSYDGANINAQLVLFRPKDNTIDAGFLYYAVANPQFVKTLISSASGAAQPQLPIKILRNLKIRFPKDVFTQRNISSVLEKYDDLIENNKRRIELLEESARQLYKEWFVRFRFPGHEHVKIIDGVPEGWIRTTADQAMDILSGGTPKTSVPDYWDGEIGFFTPKDTTDSVYVSTTEKTITTLGLEKCASNLYPKNTLFITARGTVGNLNLAQKPMAMNQSCYALVGREPITQFYLYFAMQAGIQQVKSRAVGAVFDAIIKDTFKVIPFLVPPKALVDEFTDYVQAILTQIDTLMVSTERLVQARDILLPKLMSGEIAV